MSFISAPAEQPSAVSTNLGAIFVSLELSQPTWLITSLVPGGGEKMSRHQLRAGDVSGLLARFSQLQAAVVRRIKQAFSIIVIQGAGLNGFWIHRLLKGEGIESHVVDPASIATSRRRRRAKTDGIDGEALVRALLKQRISRELDRLELLLKHLAAVEARRDALFSSATEPQAPAKVLQRLRGVGPEFAAVLWSEGLFHTFENRRQLAAYAGLASTPWQSGAVSPEQGVSKAGNARLRTTMIQLSWLWLRHQPCSSLTLWFKKRAAAGCNLRVMITALARKLLVRLWKFVTTGVVPDGVVLTIA